jgi:hypothetical protein
MLAHSPVPFSSDLLPSSVSTLPLAYDACATLAREHYENFPVASFWLPKEIRPAVAAVYAFARCADDFADEPRIFIQVVPQRRPAAEPGVKPPKRMIEFVLSKSTAAN